MILKGSQRSGGQNLATHLMRVDENDHVRIEELRGFTAEDLPGALKEAEAISRATRCRQYLFSLSLSPPERERVTAEVFRGAIERIEKELGLSGQPRAIVLHEKDGRRHAHCVCSRIDASTMTARQMSFYKTKLMGISRDLYLEHGWEIPRGILNAGEKSPANFTLAEWQQAKRKGVDPRWLKAVVQDCWQRSDGRPALEQALSERCLYLAQGDRRGAVVLDHIGEVHALSRLLGISAREVRSRIPEADTLMSLADARKSLGERMTPALRKHITESRQSGNAQLAYLATQKLAMKKRHVAARASLEKAHDVQWRSETLERSQRLPKGLRGLWHRLTGQYQQVRAANEREAAQTRTRHQGERQAQADAQLNERAALQKEIKAARQKLAERLYELRDDLAIYRAHQRSRGMER